MDEYAEEEEWNFFKPDKPALDRPRNRDSRQGRTRAEAGDRTSARPGLQCVRGQNSRGWEVKPFPFDSLDGIREARLPSNRTFTI